MSFITELKRRNVTRVAIAYLVLSWLMAQVAEMLLETFGAPPWVFKTLLALFVIGFPFALFFAWAYEMTPDGLKREKDIDPDRRAAKHPGRGLDAVIIGLLVIALGYFVYESRFKAVAPAETTPATAPNEASATAAPAETEDASIAVIPFLNLSSDKDQAYFSDGLADTILHMLAQIPGLRVAARTSSFQFRDKNEDMREIAAALGVAMVLEGSVQRQGNRVRITVQLIKGADGSHLWSKVYDETLDDIFRVQDEIASGVADAMLATPALASSSSAAEAGIEVKRLGGTENVAAYDAFLKGQTALDEGTPDGVNKALVMLQLAVELDPDFARAWVALSQAAYNSASVGSAIWQSAQKEQLLAAQKAVALAPQMASAQVAYAFALGVNGAGPKQYGPAILKAIELEPNNADALAALAHLKAVENQHRESLVLTEKAVLINPLDTELMIELAFRKMSVGLVAEAISDMTGIANAKPNDVVIQSGLSYLYFSSGNLHQAAIHTRSFLENNPDLLDALFAATFQHLYLNDIEAGDRYLKRIELLAPKRVFDDRYYFCLRTGDLACAKTSGALYLQLLRNEDSKATAARFEANYALAMGDPKRSIELLEPESMNLVDFDTVYSVDFDTDSDPYTLAIAYDKVGDTEKRDYMLGILEAKMNEGLANGLWPPLAAHHLALIAAIRGDANLAAERLALAMDNPVGFTSREIDFYTAWDTVRDDPAVKLQRDRLQAREDALRERFYAEGIW